MKKNKIHYKIIYLISFLILLFTLSLFFHNFVYAEDYAPCDGGNPCESADEKCLRYRCVPQDFECLDDGSNDVSCKKAGDETTKCLNHTCVLESTECLNNNNCDGSNVCRNKKCVEPNCVEDKDCSYGQACENNDCVEVECSQDVDCNSGRKCYKGKCTWVCSKKADCKEGEYCNNGLCEVGCKIDDDCPDGKICNVDRCQYKDDPSSKKNSCLTLNKCYKFGEKIGDGTTALSATFDECNRRNAKMFESLDACNKYLEEQNKKDDKDDKSSNGQVSEYIDPLASLRGDIQSLNKLGTIDINIVFASIIKTGLGVLGSIALVMVIYGGGLWMTASGNSEKEKKGLETLIWAGLGIVIIFASYAILDMLFETFA